MIILIRHGERADSVTSEHSKVLCEYDPPLSSLGELQSELTAKCLKLLEKEIIIVSSPFLRCLQTANIIKSQIPNAFKNTIYIEETISEILHPAWFDENVIEKLEVNKGNLTKYGLSHESLVNGFLEKNSIARMNSIKSKLGYPEFFDESFRSRYLKGFGSLLETYLKKFNPDKSVLVIITHGHGIGVTCETIDESSKGKSADYCSISQLKANNETLEIIKLKDVEHLKALSIRSNL